MFYRPARAKNEPRPKDRLPGLHVTEDGHCSDVEMCEFILDLLTVRLKVLTLNSIPVPYSGGDSAADKAHHKELVALHKKWAKHGAMWTEFFRNVLALFKSMQDGTYDESSLVCHRSLVVCVSVTLKLCCVQQKFAKFLSARKKSGHVSTNKLTAALSRDAARVQQAQRRSVLTSRPLFLSPARFFFVFALFLPILILNAFDRLCAAHAFGVGHIRSGSDSQTVHSYHHPYVNHFCRLCVCSAHHQTVGSRFAGGFEEPESAHIGR